MKLGFFTAASDVNSHIVLFAELDGTRMHDAGSGAGHFEHLVIADLIHLGGSFENPRISRVDPIDVGIDFTFFGSQGSGVLLDLFVGDGLLDGVGEFNGR